MKRCPKCHSTSDTDFCRQCGTATEEFPQDSVREAVPRDASDEYVQQSRTVRIGSKDLSSQAPAARVVHIENPEADDKPPRTRAPRPVRRARDLSPFLMAAVVSQALAIVALTLVVAVRLSPQQAAPNAPSQPPQVSARDAATEAHEDDRKVKESQAAEERKLSDTKTAVAREQNKLGDAKDAVARTERRLGALRAQVSQEERVLKDLRGERAQVETDIKWLKSQGKKKRQEVAKAEGRLKKINGDIAKAEQRRKGLREEMAWVKGGNGVRRRQPRAGGRT